MSIQVFWGTQNPEPSNQNPTSQHPHRSGLYDKLKCNKQVDNSDNLDKRNMLNARNYDKRRGVESRTKVRAKNLGGRVLKTGKRRGGRHSRGGNENGQMRANKQTA